MVRAVAYLVFLLPVVISVPLASFVMADILEEPGRELNMWRIGEGQSHSTSSISFIGLSAQYSASETIEIEAKISDKSLDCGDVYVTVYDSEDKAISQSAFFDQCFVKNQSIVPVDDNFSIKFDDSGKYRVVIEVLDKDQKHSDSASTIITVK